MRWVSFRADQYAFLSIGGQANGVIAIGGMARGIVAIGAFLSVGVVSIGMNAIGSVVAIGMNTVAPISLSLINALGLYVMAGTNGCGTVTSAGVNSTGWLSSRGGVNSERSVVPTIITMAVLVIASSIFRGVWEPRARMGTQRLAAFLASKSTRGTIRARLVAADDEALEIETRGSTRTRLNAHPKVLAEAGALLSTRPEGIDALLVVERDEESRIVEGEAGGYRERPQETTETVLNCLELTPLPELPGLLPKDAEEIQWLIAWSARISVLVAVVWVWRSTR